MQFIQESRSRLILPRISFRRSAFGTQKSLAGDFLAIYLGITLSPETSSRFIQDSRFSDPPVRFRPPDPPVTARPFARLAARPPALSHRPPDPPARVRRPTRPLGSARAACPIRPSGSAVRPACLVRRFVFSSLTPSPHADLFRPPSSPCPFPPPSLPPLLSSSLSLPPFPLLFVF